MRFLGVFLAGIGSVINFGLPNGYPVHVSKDGRDLEKDWQRIGGDLYKALKKYRAEKGNDKA